MRNKHNYFWYGLSFTIKSIIPLVSLPWFSKFLSLEEFGIFALSIFFGTFISGLSNLGLLNVLERNYFEINEEQRKNYLFTVVFFVFCTISSSILIVFLFKKNLSFLIFRIKIIKSKSILLCILKEPERWEDFFNSINYRKCKQYISSLNLCNKSKFGFKRIFLRSNFRVFISIYLFLFLQF